MNLIWKDFFEVVGAFVAIYFFAILIETPKRYLLRSAMIAALGELVYILCMNVTAKIVFSTFLSALFVAFLSHLCARIFKVPVTLFLVAGILPTVPGAGMYNTVHYIIANDEAMVSYYFTQTMEIAGVIALAIFIIDTLFELVQKGDWKQNSLKYVRIVKGKETTTKK